MFRHHYQPVSPTGETSCPPSDCSYEAHRAIHSAFKLGLLLLPLIVIGKHFRQRMWYMHTQDHPEAENWRAHRQKYHPHGPVTPWAQSNKECRPVEPKETKPDETEA